MVFGVAVVLWCREYAGSAVVTAWTVRAPAVHACRVKKAVLKEALYQARRHFVNHVVPVLRRRQLQVQQKVLRIGLPEARRLVQANHKGAQ